MPRRVGKEVGGVGSRQRLHENHRARRAGRHGRRHGKHVPHWAWQTADGQPARWQGCGPGLVEPSWTEKDPSVMIAGVPALWK